MNIKAEMNMEKIRGLCRFCCCLAAYCLILVITAGRDLYALEMDPGPVDHLARNTSAMDPVDTDPPVADQPAEREIPAFPGAEGFGTTTPGGRGGKVYLVTTLADYLPGSEEPIPGSFRLACESSSPRMVIFRVSGTIELKYPVVISEPYITIAGQTAPGDGICLKNYSLVITGTGREPVHDVIVQYLRIRPGDLRDRIGSPAPARNDMALTGNDGIGIHNAENIVIDHCSVSWGVDENVEATGNCHNITFQWNLIAEGLHNSMNFKGAHSKGLMVGYNSSNISIHHNLMMHSTDRNPYLPAEGSEPFIIDMVNNVVYNWWVNPGVSYAKDNHNGTLNFIGNYYIPGVNSWESPSLRLGVDTRVYAKGNMGPRRSNENPDEYSVVEWFGPAQRHNLKATQRFDAPPVTTLPWDQSYKAVLEQAGAVLPRRDAMDNRLVREVQQRKGRIIDHPSQVGGWPELNGQLAAGDKDSDGMPDEWEVAMKLNPGDPGDASKDRDGDGYTNLEEWIQTIRVMPDYLLTESGLPGSGTIEDPVRVSKHEAAFKIDGNPVEWKDIPSLPLPFSGRSKSSVRMAWNEYGLVGLVTVKDTLVRPYESDPYWADGLELFIETDNAKAPRREDTRHAIQIIFSPTEDLVSGPCNINFPRDWPGELAKFVFAAWRLTREGYVIEFILDPYFFLPDRLKEGKMMGIEFALDNEGKPVEMFYSDKNKTGIYPERWGTIVLTK